MIHDPCMFPQLRSKKRERDDWFLVRMGCFNGDPDGEGSGKGGASDLGDAGEAIASDADSALGFEDDEAADYQDRVDEAMKQTRDRGDDTDEIEDYFDRTEVVDRRAPIDIPRIQGIPDIDFDEESDRNESPLNFAGDPRNFPGGERDLQQRNREFEEAVERQIQADRKARAVGADGPDPVDIFDSYDPDEPEGGAGSLTALRPDLARDPSRPPVSIVPAATTPAEQIIAEARGKQRTSDQTAQSIAEAAPTPEGVQEDVPFSIRTMRGPTFSPDPEEFQQFDETDYLDLGKIGPAPPKGEEDNRASDSLVERRERGIAAARAAAAQNPLAQSPDLKGIQIGDVNIPLGPAGMVAQGIATVGTDIYNTFANPTAKTIDNIQNKGHGAVYGAEGNLIGSVDPDTGAVQATEGNAFNPELEPYFAEYRERQERGRGDNVAQPILPLAGQEPVPVAPESYIGQPIVQPYQYTPAPPVQFSYTGIPTLAPTMLKPTFQAQESFSPLFNLGQTRRS